MSALGLDPRLTFESLVVGPANRLAGAAAMRVAEHPGSAYNPLFLYGAPGLGKTHLLMAIGNRAAVLHPHLPILYDTVEHLIGRSTGTRGGVRAALLGIRILLLDDIQDLSEHPGAQEELLEAWDAVMAAGGQVAIASDRAPAEIEPIDRSLASRFGGGIVADLAPPEHETRITIVERRAAERGHQLGDGVADALARVAFGSVRELHGGLNRVLAIQELEARTVAAREVLRLLGFGAQDGDSRGNGEFSSFVSEISGTIGEVLERLAPEQRLAEAILRWEGEGYSTTRLEAALTASPTPDQARAAVATYTADVARLERLQAQIRELDPSAPELARTDVFQDPDRVEHAAALLARVVERVRGAITAEEHAGGTNGHARTPAPPARNLNDLGVAELIEIAEAASAVADADRAAGHAAADGAGASSLDRAHGKEAVPEIHDRAFLSPEKVLWDWPYLEDVLVADDR